jgi:acyl-CoA synthetase (AMP-forming)/AMP-acid ligase II
MTDRLDDELLARYLAGEAGAGDRARVEAWAGADAQRSSELERLHTAWAQRPAAGTWTVDAAWERIRPLLDQPGLEPLRPGRRLWIRYAAAAAVLLAAAAILSRPGPTPSVHETAIGEQREIDLSDGTRVVLAPAAPDDVVVLAYTSGTTGNPKGVMHDHRSLLSELRHMAGWATERPQPDWLTKVLVQLRQSQSRLHVVP